MKFGVEFNRVHSNQTFRGFQNGRYIFGSTDGFLNYSRNPRYVECSNGTTSETGSCPSGTSITGPLLLFLQQVGVGGLSAEPALGEALAEWIVDGRPELDLSEISTARFAGREIDEAALREGCRHAYATHYRAERV